MDSHDAPQRSSTNAFPGLALALGITWLLAGAIYKLFDGNVADLPQSVLDKSPFEPFDTFRYAIAAELAVVGLVIALPRIGWLALAGVFATFLVVLFPLFQAGAESCGCFGGTVKISPGTMMAIDGGLLFLILASRPWRLPRGAGLGFLAAVVLIGAGIYAPLKKIPALDAAQTKTQNPALVDGKKPPIIPSGPSVAANGTDNSDTEVILPVGATDGKVPDIVPATTQEPEDQNSTDDKGGTGDTPSTETVENTLPQFMNLTEFDGWVGQNVWELPFIGVANFDEGAFMPDSHVIVYRQQCDVCKEHLRDMQDKINAADPEIAGRSLVLVRITQESDTAENNVCDVLPSPAQKVTLPALDRGYLITTPMSFDVDGTETVSKVTDVRKVMGK